MVQKNFGLERYQLIKTPTNPLSLSLWSGKDVSKTKQLPFPVGKNEIPKLYHSPWVPVGSPLVSRGSPHREGNDKCIMMKSTFSTT